MLYRLTPHLHLGSEFSYVQMGARDQAKERGLAFASTNGLGTVFFRFDLLPDESIFAASMAEAPIFQVFVQGGAGLLLYNPQAYLGMPAPTKPTSSCRPSATTTRPWPAWPRWARGFSLRLTDQLRASLEGNYYFTTTDQLDDVNLASAGHRQQPGRFRHRDAEAGLLAEVSSLILRCTPARSPCCRIATRPKAAVQAS